MEEPAMLAEDYDCVSDGPTSFPDSRYSLDQSREYLSRLEDAIQSGNVSVAVEMAEQLASMQLLVRIKRDESFHESQEDYISVKIHLEDRMSKRGSFVWKLKPSISVQTLKWKMFETHGYPPDVQKWVIGTQLAKDSDKLLDYGINSGDSSMYLYLMIPKPDISVSGSLNFSNSSQQSGSLVGNSLPTSIEILPQPQQILPHSSSSSSLPLPIVDQQPQQVGWQCPFCTYVNEPTRPGCDMCSGDRPMDYQPPVNYQPSERERERLLQEQYSDSIIAATQLHTTS